ncbi:molybdopterin-dependent oxidoreductase [Chitinibacter tainanensis]|uniref:molybdopterin-dependent oxidoreductase n=1 Tax=Chitinibacter tainanensis TaxID=230667 RepID=UPI0003F5CAB0|nr:molybdopterin-dependent oxidoreductase [Chitinibacter tainanensis]
MLRTFGRLITFALLALASLSFANETNTTRTILTIKGKVTTLQALSLADLDKLPQYKMTVPTPWYPEPQTFEGPLLRDVLKLAGVSSGALRLSALNDYTIEIPASDAFTYDVIVASRLGGKTMSIREKGPLFIMYPFDQHADLRKTDYYRRCAWQLKLITVQ